MSIESIKPEIAKVIAIGCDITQPQALKLIEHAMKPIGEGNERKIVVQGFGDVFLKAQGCAASVKGWTVGAQRGDDYRQGVSTVQRVKLALAT